MKKSLLCFFVVLTALATGCDKNDSSKEKDIVPGSVAFHEYTLEVDHSEWYAATRPEGVLYGHEVYKVRSADQFRQLFPAAPVPSFDFRKEVLLIAHREYSHSGYILTPSLYRNDDGSLVLHVKIEDTYVQLPVIVTWRLTVGIDDSLADEPGELRVEELGYTGD